MTKEELEPIEIEKILPRGFVFEDRSLITNTRELTELENFRQSQIHVITKNKGIETSHDYKYLEETCRYKSNADSTGTDGEKELWEQGTGFGLGSKSYNEGFSNGTFFLLSEEQFDEFKRLKESYHNSPRNEELVRTVEGIEKFLGS